MVAKLCDYDFEDYDLQKVKYKYVESGIESSNEKGSPTSSMAAYLIILNVKHLCGRKSRICHASLA